MPALKWPHANAIVTTNTTVKLFRTLDNLPAALRRGAVTIGNFDGVHRGHARIIERLVARAGQVHGPAIVFTFDPHPVRLLRPELAPPPLTWTDRKAALLAELNVDAVIAYRTNRALLALPPEEFFRQIVLDRLEAKAMVEGPNFYFGHDRAGDVHLLNELCHAAGIPLEVVQPLLEGDQIVSSSRVRDAIRAGDVQAARHMLTRPYRIRGMVTHGAGRGAEIGFPTANVDAIDTLLPAHGVYAGVAYVNGGRWTAAINIGPNPTFGEHAEKVEVHLIDFVGSLYNQPLEVDFLSKLRDIHPFASVEQLKEQLAKDVQAAKELAATQT